jgi:hypothetical protein
MSKQNWIFLSVALVLIGITAICLNQLSGHQRLGRPAIKTSPLPNSNRLAIELPEDVLDYTSKNEEVTEMELKTLPADTSFAKRQYTAPDGSWALATVVLMGSDRTSLHRTEFCLQGQGWQVDPNASVDTTIRMERPFAYDLPVKKYIAQRQVTINGQTDTYRAVYVFWFVAENEYTASHGQRMWWMARDLLSTGVLQRWAAVSYFAVCHPGQEDATFQRMKRLIVASVPKFQLTPAAGRSNVGVQVGEASPIIAATPGALSVGPALQATGH